MNKVLLLATLAAANFALQPCVLAAEEGHVLAAKQEGFAQAPGTKITTETTVEIQAAKLNLLIQPPPRKSPGEPQKEPTMQEGSLTRLDTRVEKMEVLSPTKARRILEEAKTEGAMSFAGQDRPIPNPPAPLAKLPMIVDYKDGKYTVSLESGEPAPAQAQLLAQFSKTYSNNNDAALYGTSPRKPGEKWNVNPKGVTMMGEAEDLAGSYTIEFVEVKDFQGTPCAVLKASFDISGTSPNGKMGFKGSSTTLRSLADKLDLEVKVDATMTMDSQPNPQVSTHAEGPYKSVQKTTVVKP